MTPSTSPSHTRAVKLPADDIDLIASSVTLPNGVVIRNRLAKAAMEEGLPGGLPGRKHRRLYRRWGGGGWGVILTGNVQVDASQPATPHDLCFYDSPHTVPLFHELHDALIADACAECEDLPLTLVQLSHAGIQSSALYSLARSPFAAAIGPVAGRPSLGKGIFAWAIEHALWPTASREVTDPAEWSEIAGKFAEAAACMEDAGWGGVQVHSAHGYLLAEYLSPLTNPYPKPLPGVPEHIPLRLHLLWLILTGIHAATERVFVKAVKINCSDFVQGGLDEAASTEIIHEIVSWHLVDLLEISGGNYTNPAFTESSNPRESLFAHFTRALLPTLPEGGPVIMLTGGLHDRNLIASSLRTGACDIVGIARPAALIPDLPRRVILNRELPENKATVGGYSIPNGALAKRLLGGGGAVNGPGTIKLVGAGVGTCWHEWQMVRLGAGEEPDPQLDWIRGAILYILWFGILGGGPRGWLARYMGWD